MTARRCILESPLLGRLEWDEGNEIRLPHGLPGFESERFMLPVEIPAQRPLVYLQSLEHPEVCFVTLPARTIDPSFELTVNEDDKTVLGLIPDVRPLIGEDVLCLALLRPADGTVNANLSAPVVINLHNSRCMQTFDPESEDRQYHLNAAGVWERLC